jgi:cytochrome b
MNKIRVWDLPLRLFHWTLAVLVVAAVITQKIGGNAMVWHFRIGYCVLALLLFRLIWGVVGPRYSRFVDFLRGPMPILDYLKGNGRNYPGHNPLGSLSVVALLGFLLFQVATGLFSNDDIASEGPLVKFISKEISDQATWLHKELGATVIYVLVGLHVLAILWYAHLKKEKLVKAMITGDKDVDYEAEAAKDGIGTRLLAVVVIAVAAGGVWWLVNLQR